MKRITLLLLLAALSGSGCLSLPVLWTEPELPPPPVEQEAPPPPPLAAEEVTENNYDQAAKALREELDRAAERPAPPALPPTTSTAKPKR